MQPTEHDDVAEVLDAARAEPAAAEPPPADAEPESTDFLEELAALEAELDEQEAESVSDLFATEAAEKAGRWFRWPALRGAEIQIAHFSASVDRKAELEATYRKKKSKLPNEPLPAKVEERLWEEAIFGTVVRGWRGLRDGDRELVFNELSFRKLMRLRRFRSFVLSKAREAQNFRDASRDELAGN